MCKLRAILYGLFYNRWNFVLFNITGDLFEQNMIGDPNEQNVCQSCYPYKIKVEEMENVFKIYNEKPELFDEDFTLDCW